MKSIWLPFIAFFLVVIVVFIIGENLEQEFTAALSQVEHAKLQFATISFFILLGDILLPVPSSIVMYLNGYVLGILSGSCLSFVSLLAGSCVGYYLGKFTSMGVKAKKDERAHLFLLKYGAFAILITRGIPILAESICLVCGYNNMSFKQYILLNTIGYIPLCLLYAFFGQSGYDQHNFLFSFIASLLVSAAFWFLGKTYFTKWLNNPIKHA
ncbi:MAG: DedA family protein [Bacteroidetes bacterium]|nr:MAG: DedA family protein [Bacteroidota bacterium]